MSTLSSPIPFLPFPLQLGSIRLYLALIPNLHSTEPFLRIPSAFYFDKPNTLFGSDFSVVLVWITPSWKCIFYLASRKSTLLVLFPTHLSLFSSLLNLFPSSSLLHITGRSQTFWFRFLYSHSLLWSIRHSYRSIWYQLCYIPNYQSILKKVKNIYLP